MATIKTQPTLEERTAKRQAEQTEREERLRNDLGVRYARSIRDVFDGDTPPVEWIVPGAIPRANVTLITGESGSGKSWIGYELIRAVASGTSWLHRGEALPSPERALILNYDMPTPTMRRRAKQIGITRDMPVYFHSLGLSQVVGSQKALLLLEPENTIALKYVIQWVKPALILIDTFRQAHHFDENDSAQMGQVMSFMKSFTAINRAAVVAVHHTNKGGSSKWETNARGSGEIVGSADVVLEVAENKVMWKKHRPWDLSGNSSVAFQLVDRYLDLNAADDDVLVRTTVKATQPLPGEEDQRNVRAVVRALVDRKAKPFVSSDELAAALRFKPNTFYKAVAQAREQRLVTVVKTTSGAGYKAL